MKVSPQTCIEFPGYAPSNHDSQCWFSGSHVPTCISAPSEVRVVCASVQSKGGPGSATITRYRKRGNMGTSLLFRLFDRDCPVSGLGPMWFPHMELWELSRAGNNFGTSLPGDIRVSTFFSLRRFRWLNLERCEVQATRRKGSQDNCCRESIHSRPWKVSLPSGSLVRQPC